MTMRHKFIANNAMPRFQKNIKNCNKLLLRKECLLQPKTCKKKKQAKMRSIFGHRQPQMYNRFSWKAIFIEWRRVSLLTNLHISRIVHTKTLLSFNKNKNTMKKKNRTKTMHTQKKGYRSAIKFVPTPAIWSVNCSHAYFNNRIFSS